MVNYTGGRRFGLRPAAVTRCLGRPCPGHWHYISVSPTWHQMDKCGPETSNGCTVLQPNDTGAKRSREGFLQLG